MAQMGELPRQRPIDTHPVVSFLNSTLNSACMELAKLNVEVACLVVFNKEVFVVGTERGKGYANIRLDFQRDFISYCVSEKEKDKDQQRIKDPCFQDTSDELNRDNLKMAADDLCSPCCGCHCFGGAREDAEKFHPRDGKATGKSGLVAVPYAKSPEEPSDVPVLGERKMKGKETGEAVKCENASLDCFVTVQVKSEPHETQEESDMSVKEEEEGDDPQNGCHCFGGAREDAEEFHPGEGPPAVIVVKEDPEEELTIEASATCLSAAGMDQALGPGRKQAEQTPGPNCGNKNTRRCSKWGVTVLKNWYQDRFGRPAAALERMAPAELDRLLCEFYLNAKTAKKGLYSKNSLTVIRRSISRYLRGHHPLRRPLNILCEHQFPDSNRTYREVCSALEMEGRAGTKHTVSMTTADLLKLYQSSVLGTGSPQTLLNKVWFDVMFFLVRGRGGSRHIQRELKRDSFRFGVDEHGDEFVSLLKNDRRMYALPGDPRCPVSALRLYLSKLHPTSTALFLHPPLQSSADVWYTTKPLGVNNLGCMMSKLSKQARLSAIYTNHSIKMTPVSLLQEVLQRQQKKAPVIVLTLVGSSVHRQGHTTAIAPKSTS